MTFMILVLGAVLLGQIPRTTAIRAFPDQIAGQHVERVRVLEAKTFTEKALISLAQGFLRNVQQRYRTGVLWIFTDPKDIELLSLGLPTEETFQQWRAVALERLQRQYSLCRVTVMGQTGVAEIRWGNGVVQTVLLDGVNPLEVVAGGIKYRIAYLQAQSVQPGQGFLAGNREEYRIWLVGDPSEPLTVDLAVWRSFCQKLGSHTMIVFVRTDHWFRGGSIPAVYPFAAKAMPPSFSEWSRRDHGSYVSDRRGLDIGLGRSGGKTVYRHYEVSELR